MPTLATGAVSLLVPAHTANTNSIRPASQLVLPVLSLTLTLTNAFRTVPSRLQMVQAV
jgi:hypothetical protein